MLWITLSYIQFWRKSKSAGEIPGDGLTIPPAHAAAARRDQQW
jgi:hypothetical protein